MNDVNWHFLIPSRHTLDRGEPLNVLIGVENPSDEDMTYPIRVLSFSDSDGEPRLLYKEEKLLPAKQTTHVYLTIPGKAMSRIWDDEFIICLEGGRYQELIYFREEDDGQTV